MEPYRQVQLFIHMLLYVLTLISPNIWIDTLSISYEQQHQWPFALVYQRIVASVDVRRRR